MNWHAYFIQMIDVIKLKSKDTSTQVGCVIVGPNHEIRTTGFNGFPRGVDDSIKERFERPAKYLWTEHSERNAIYNAARNGVSLDGCSIYLSWIPCVDCARAIVQSGIKYVFIDGRDFEVTEKYWNERWAESMEVSKTILKEACVALVVVDKNGKVYAYPGNDENESERYD